MCAARARSTPSTAWRSSSRWRRVPRRPPKCISTSRNSGTVYGRECHPQPAQPVDLRGALVRDPHGWAGYLTEAIDTFAGRADVVFASHHWPTWGQDNIVEYLSVQRDLYAYLHDQTLRQLNQGFTGIEIAETFQMPPAWRRPGTPTATTGRSVTTSRRSTSVIWAGSTATPPAGSGSIRPPKPRPALCGGHGWPRQGGRTGPTGLR